MHCKATASVEATAVFSRNEGLILIEGVGKAASTRDRNVASAIKEDHQNLGSSYTSLFQLSELHSFLNTVLTSTGDTL